jgi:peptidoglycan/xylan/chitin deacetylase (PgdA/CDA1 family)
MRLVSPLLKHAIYPALHHSGWLNHMTPPAGFAVVNYHGVVPADDSGSGVSSQDGFLDANLIRPQAFRRQLRFLKDHYHVIRPEDFRTSVERSKPLPARAVLLTCDDGLLNTLTDMLPILLSENVSCLFFVTAASCADSAGMLWYEELYCLMRSTPVFEQDLQLPAEEQTKFHASDNFQARWWGTVRRASRIDADRRADWLAQVRDRYGPMQDFRPEKRWRLLNVAELRQLAAAGMSIGAHTRSHPILSLCSEEEARREIGESKSELEQVLGQPVWAFAYPFGNSSTMGEREVRLAREAGFGSAFLNVENWNIGQENAGQPDPQVPNRFALPRIQVTVNTTLPEFAAHVSGLHTRLQLAVGN